MADSSKPKQLDASADANAPLRGQEGDDRLGWRFALSLIIAWSLLIVALIALAGFPIAVWRTIEFRMHSVRAMAPIVDFRKYAPTRGHTESEYRPIVAVTDGAGRVSKVLVGAADYTTRDGIGVRIAVLYTPGREAHAVKDDFSGVWAVSMLFGVFATAGLALGAGTIMRMRAFVRAEPRRLILMTRASGPLRLLIRPFI